MAKPKLDILLKNLALELGDEIENPGDDGETYTFEGRLEAINRARGTVYTNMLKAFNNNFDKFLKLYPEFVEVKRITFNSFIAVKPEDVRYCINGNVGALKFEPVKPGVLIESLTDTESLFYADSNNLKYFEYKDKIVLYGTATDPIELSMVCVLQPIDVNHDTYSGVKATGILTAAAKPVNNDTVTIGAKTYTFKTALTVPAVPNEILIGADASATLDNLIAAITGGAGAGTLYSTGTEAHSLVTASAGAGDTMNVEALSVGETGNAIATTETSANLSWGSATLTGGIDAYAYDIIEPWAWLDLIVIEAKAWIDRNLQE